MHQQQQQRLQEGEALPQGTVPESEDAPPTPSQAPFNPADAYLQIWNTMQQASAGGAAGHPSMSDMLGHAGAAHAASTALGGEGAAGHPGMPDFASVAKWCASLPSGAHPAPLQRLTTYWSESTLSS